MHGRMDSDDEESGDGEDVAAAAEPDADFDLAVDIVSKSGRGSDAVEIDPENDPIRVAPSRVVESKRAAVPAAAAAPAKKNVKSLTLAERLLLDKKVNDGQRVEVSSHFMINFRCRVYYFY